MKIRTDFVTNSSSSSFVAILDIVLDNGEKKRFVAESSEGGGEGGWIIPPKKKDGEIEKYQIRSLEQLSKDGITVKGKTYHFSEGVLTLQCHTYGEYGYESNPSVMLEENLDSRWKEVHKQIEDMYWEDDESQLAELRKISFLDKYKDESVLDLFESITCEDNDTEIIQTLHKDGSMEIQIDFGEDLFDIENESDMFDDEEDDDEDDED